MKFRSKLLLILLFTSFIIFNKTSQPNEFNLFIVKNEQPNAVIAISLNSSLKELSAAKFLQRYIEKSTHATLPIKKLSHPFTTRKNTIHIWIGDTEYSNNICQNIDKLKGDSFVISVIDSNNIVIKGGSDWGTMFGVYEFLEKYIGIRWLFPGELGEYIPKKANIPIPAKTVVQQPAFFSRHLGGLIEQDHLIWANRNKMHVNINFHHNLSKLFPPEKYYKSHPEFFPLINGKRYLPKSNNDDNWQPCFSAPGLKEEAVKNIISYFSQNPEKISFSIGINDSSRHCQCDSCSLIDSHQKNSLGLPNLSDRYFIWANAVVKEVLKKYPKKLFGCLAYRELADPPVKVSVHSHIIPYLTYDRLKWASTKQRNTGELINAKWEKSAKQIGWYDYIYGTPYCIPRVYFDEMSKYYKYAQNHSVTAMYAEAYPNWGEGPKLYITLKLMWDPNLDMNTLLEDWYISAVGKNAAPDLAAYFDLWNKFWTIRVINTEWFKNDNEYLLFKDPSYLDIVTYYDIEKSKKLLKSVEEKANTSKQKLRAKYFSKSFEYYEASVLSYLFLVKGEIDQKYDAKYYLDMNAKRYQLIKDFRNDSFLRHPVPFNDKRYKGSLEWISPIKRTTPSNRTTNRSFYIDRLYEYILP